MGNEPGYPSEQQEEFQYSQAIEESDPNADRQADNRSNYGEEQAVPRRSIYDQYPDNVMRRLMEKKRELAVLRSQRQRLREGETGTYEMPHQMQDTVPNLSEVPESMRSRPSPRDIELEKERRRKQIEFQRYQSRSLSRPAGYRPAYPRDQSSSKYAAEMLDQRYPANSRPATTTQQWSPDVHGYPDAQYVRQGQPRPQYVQGHARRQMPEQVMSPEDVRQYQRARRRAMFNVPKN